TESGSGTWVASRGRLLTLTSLRGAGGGSIHRFLTQSHHNVAPRTGLGPVSKVEKRPVRQREPLPDRAPGEGEGPNVRAGWIRSRSCRWPVRSESRRSAAG